MALYYSSQFIRSMSPYSLINKKLDSIKRGCLKAELLVSLCPHKKARHMQHFYQKVDFFVENPARSI